MATTKKATEKVETDTIVDKSNFEEEIKKLEAERKELEALKAEIMAMKPVVKEKAPKKIIKFINLVPGTLVMRGSRIWEIEGQFKTLSLTESEASIVVTSNPSLIHSGYVYVADKDFVEEHDLADAYDYILSDKVMKDLFNRESKEFIDLYNSTSDEQKKIIVNMIIARKKNGEPVDGNILAEIGKECGKNLFEIEPEDR